MVGKTTQKFGAVWRRPQRSEYGRKALTVDQKWSVETTVGSEVVGKRSRRSLSGQETLPEDRMLSGDPFGCSVVIRRPY